MEITTCLFLSSLNDRKDLFDLACPPDAEAWWEGELEIVAHIDGDRGDYWTAPVTEVELLRIELDGVPVPLEWLEALGLVKAAEGEVVAVACDLPW